MFMCLKDGNFQGRTSKCDAFVINNNVFVELLVSEIFEHENY